MKLLETTKKFPQTEIWNDSCSCKELAYAIKNGAVGATTNPVIVNNVLKSEITQWEKTIKKLIKENETATEDEISWLVIKAIGTKAASLLLPKFEESKGKQGRISFQTNAKYYRNPKKMIEQACDLASTVVNSQIKAPASKAGIEAFEELTYRGISINATVSFTVSQAIEVAEAVERGLNRRLSEGLPIDNMHPVCTIMAGRVDDYLKKFYKSKDIIVEPETLEWAGVAILKKAISLYKKRNYHTTLLVAAYRNHHHWLEFIGENIVLTITYLWQKKFNESEYEIKDYSNKQVDDEILNKLMKLPEFVKAYDEKGMSKEEFEHYGAFIDTINQFLNGYDDLVKLIRKYMVV